MQGPHVQDTASPAEPTAELRSRGHTADEIAEARRHLAAIDPALARADRATPVFAWRVQEGGFAGLVQLVIEQQVSTASAAAISARFRGAFRVLSPRAVLARDEASLRALGLSLQKAQYVRGIAAAARDGTLDFAAVAALPDAAAADHLMAVKGVGRWTAEAYLMGCEGRTDVFPAGDLALQEGLRMADGAPARLRIDALTARAEAWKPYRGVAAHLLWGFYRAVKKGDVAAPRPAP